jgi:hypothetical protein
MRIPVTTQDGIKSQESLEKVFHVLFTPTMYAAIESRSAALKISKGALIRSAVERHLRSLASSKSVGNQEQNHSNNLEA